MIVEERHHRGRAALQRRVNVLFQIYAALKGRSSTESVSHDVPQRYSIGTGLGCPAPEAPT